METTVNEIADGIFRFSTLVPDAAPGGFTFNQFLVKADEPLLFHTGPRQMFPLVSQAVATVVPIETIRWIAFGHVEADECGSMNEWLAAAPDATVAHGGLGVAVSLNDLADRPPRSLEDNEVIDLGGKRVRHLDTPHVPHAWEARLLYEETTGTLLCGDLFTQAGNGDAVTEGDIIGPSIELEQVMRYTSNPAALVSTVRGLAELAPKTLACMHGSSYTGDGAKALNQLADAYEETFVRG
ncbi:MAG: MBL fold metallo-hydrolase [Acidimicrobiales bacterium]